MSNTKLADEQKEQALNKKIVKHANIHIFWPESKKRSRRIESLMDEYQGNHKGLR